MTNEIHNTQAILVDEIKENEKFPKEIFVRNLEEERKFGITDLKCAVFRDSSYGNYTELKITGEYNGKCSKYILMLLLIYNGNGELIEANFDEEISEKFKGKKTFTYSLDVPNDEYISKIAVRFILDPVFIW